MGYMGPVVGDVQHEGWVVPFFADGAESAGTTSNRGVLVDFDRDEWRPDSDVIGWRAGCDCGWRGPEWLRVASPGEAEWVDVAGRLIHNPDSAYLEPDAEQVVIDEWRQHIAPHKLMERVEEAAEAYTTAGRELDKLVTEAHAAGASWADIGRAVGITRQSARERWGSRL
jgi:hypothetical protein